MINFLIKDVKSNLKQPDNLVLSLGALANIVAKIKVTSEESKNMYFICEGVLELENLTPQIEQEAIRVLSNNIGISDDWVENGYKESIGLDRQ